MYEPFDALLPPAAAPANGCSCQLPHLWKDQNVEMHRSTAAAPAAATSGGGSGAARCCGLALIPANNTKPPALSVQQGINVSQVVCCRDGLSLQLQGGNIEWRQRRRRGRLPS